MEQKGTYRASPESAAVVWELGDPLNTKIVEEIQISGIKRETRKRRHNMKTIPQ